MKVTLTDHGGDMLHVEYLTEEGCWELTIEQGPGTEPDPDSGPSFHIQAPAQECS